MQTSINLFKVPPFCISLVSIIAGNLFKGLIWNVWLEHLYNNLPNVMVDRVQNSYAGPFLCHTDGGIRHFYMWFMKLKSSFIGNSWNNIHFTVFTKRWNVGAWTEHRRTFLSDWVFTSRRDSNTKRNVCKCLFGFEKLDFIRFHSDWYVYMYLKSPVSVSINDND